MNEFVKISATIVLYKNNKEVLLNTINSFLNTNLKKHLFLIDNSPTDILKKIINHPEVDYIFNGNNLGFSKAHNTVLSKLNSDFHLILNPDVEFNKNVIPNLINILKVKDNCSFITPKVVYPNKDFQFVCRKHPSIFDLINRKLKISKKRIFLNQYQNYNLNKSFYPEFIHGCFMLFKTKDFINLNGFDERYFLYMEDADICRKIDKIGKKKLFYPEIQIIHHHQKGSSKKINLFLKHTSSAIKYFLKWGF